MDFRRSIVAAITASGVLLLAGGSALATSHTIKEFKGKLPGDPCPPGYKAQGAVTKVDEGGTRYTCVPLIPKVTCGPGTEYFSHAATCSFGCQGILKPTR